MSKSIVSKEAKQTVLRESADYRISHYSIEELRECGEKLRALLNEILPGRTVPNWAQALGVSENLLLRVSGGHKRLHDNRHVERHPRLSPSQYSGVGRGKLVVGRPRCGGGEIVESSRNRF